MCVRVSLGIYASGCEWAGSGVKHASCAEQKMQGVCTCCECVCVSVFLWVFMPQGVSGLVVVCNTRLVLSRRCRVYARVACVYMFPCFFGYL
jgi:S-adenosylmethionine/arginine decarboxylase-like enzyme